MARYKQRKDGEGFAVPAKQIVRWACCDCGLVHDLVFVNGRGKVGVAARRNRRATSARRRALKLNTNVQGRVASAPKSTDEKSK